MACFVLVLFVVVIHCTFCYQDECDNFPNSKCCFRTDYNLIFNLCPLKLTNESQIPYYQIKDTVYNDDRRSYRYTFNIGETPLEYPSKTCAMHRGSYCDKFNSDRACIQPPHLINDTFPAKAWAYMEKIYEIKGETVATKCWNLAGTGGSIVTYPATSFLSPFESDKNYATGVQVHYNDGDYDDHAERNRFLSLYIFCKNTYNGNGIVNQLTMYQSKPSAEYAMTFESIYGCPISCISGGQLCSTNGVCGYDFTLNHARCYCFQGFNGDFCEIPDQINDENDNHEDQILWRQDNKTKDDDNENEQYRYSIPTNFLSSSGAPLDITFDLNPMINEIGKYLKIENLNDKTTEFYLNSVGKMSDRKSMNMSTNAYEKCYELDNGNGYGFYYNILHQECYILGTDMEYGLIDETRPAKGWFMKWYNNDTNGTDKCVEEGRSFTIPAWCPDTDGTSFNPPPIFPYPIHELDDTGCKWQSEQIIALGCPSACIKVVESEISTKTSKDLIKYSICGLHGVCALDPYKEATTCLCDYGYKGDDCSIPIDYPTSIPTSLPTQDRNDENDSFMTLNKQMFLIVIGGVSALILLLIVALIICKCYYDGRKKLDDLRYKHLENIASPNVNSMDGVVDDAEDSSAQSDHQLIDTHDNNDAIYSP